jgi:hypothetical protein
MLDLAGRASVQRRGARLRDGYSGVSCSSFALMSARSVTLSGVGHGHQGYLGDGRVTRD